MRAIDGILPAPEPDVLVGELAASWVSLRVRWWTAPDRATVLRVRDQVLARIKQALPAAGIDLPYDTKVVLFHDQTEETDGDRRRQREGWPAGDKRPPRPRRLLEAAMRHGAEAAAPRDPAPDGPVENRAEVP
jgi:small-conductance mechanosensitive channel